MVEQVGKYLTLLLLPFRTYVLAWSTPGRKILIEMRPKQIIGAIFSQVIIF